MSKVRRIGKRTRSEVPEKTGSEIVDAGKVEVVKEKPVVAPVELTEKQKADRARDCKVRYGRAVNVTGSSVVESLLSERMFKGLDKERAEKWVPEEVVEGMPQWRPVIGPVIQRVLGEQSELVSKFMKTPSRGDREKIVGKLLRVVMGELVGKDEEVVTSVLWRSLFDLQKEQGVNLMTEIRKMVKV